MSEAATSSDARPGSRRRAWLGVATTLLVLSAAVGAGLLASPDGGTPVIFVERISSAIGGLTSGAGGTIWWVYAFLLGVVAAFNPCGFALLPAYLGLYLNDQQAGDDLAARTKRSLKVSLVVAGAFTVLFGATGALFSLASTLIVRLLPWVGLGVGLVYMAVLVAFRGKAGALVAILGSLVLVAGLVAFTPLRQVVEDRIAHPHSNERRASLSEQAVEGALNSPLFGYGGPRESAENPNQPDVGTHGQVYLVMFSHGIPGLVFFLGWWLWALWVSLKGKVGLPLWCHVVLLIGLIEFLYYDMMPTELHLMMVVAALAWRELEADTRPGLPARAARPVREPPSPAVR